MGDEARDDRDAAARGEELKLPEERVEDLEPDAEASDGVKGGAFKQGFPVKWQGAG